MDAKKELEELTTPLGITKFIGGTAASLGAAAAITCLMKSPLKNVKGLSKLGMTFGVFVLACKAGDIADDYFNKVVDEIVDFIQDFKKEMKKA